MLHQKKRLHGAFWKKINKVYLLGGYFRNSNFGDVIQALAWYHFYLRKKFHVSIIYDASSQNTDDFAYFLPKATLIDYSHILNGSHKISPHAILHLYGGGHLNEAWGDCFLDILALFDHTHHIILTGIQTDKHFYKKFIQKIGFRKNITWISVRDPITLKIIQRYNSRAYICDDSFLYLLLENKYPIKKTKSSSSSKLFLLNLNLSRRVISQIYPTRGTWSFFYSETRYSRETEKAREAVCGFLKDLNDNNLTPIVLSSFYKELKDEPEGAYLFKDPLFKPYFPTRTIRSAFELPLKGEYYRFGIATGFHPAIFMRLVLGIPVIFISLNPYYKQKVQCLIHTKIVKPQFVITKLSELKNIPKMISKIERNFDDTHLRNVAQSVVAEVDSIIDPFIHPNDRTVNRAFCQT